MNLSNKSITTNLNLNDSKKGPSPLWKWIMGVAFTFFIALLGYLLAFIPGFDQIGQLACAILIAVMYRQFFDYPKAIHSGIAFSSKYLLRTAIVLYGLKLNIQIVLNDGMDLLIRDVGVIIFSILLTFWIAHLLKADKMISFLLGVGTGICGAAAIASVAPIMKAKEEDTAISVGIIALIGTLFSIGYTMLRPFLPLDMISYGIWSGTSLHEVAHVALATAPAGEDALAIGMLAKLGRVFLLVPFCFILIAIMNHKNKGKATTKTKIEFPWFLVGFIILSMFGTYVSGESVILPESFMDFTFNATTWILTAAMVGLGLNVNLRHLKTKALKPLIAMTITSISLSIIVYFLVM